MDFNQLNYFRALVRHQQFTEAADELHLSQSTLSKQIKALESELSTSLFRRTAKGCELTGEGKMFNDFALKTLKNKEELLQKLSESASIRKNTVHLGTMPILGEYHISDTIAAFMHDYPAYTIHVTELANSEDLLKHMKNLDFNLIFTGSGLLDRTSFIEIPLIKDYLRVIVSQNNLLSHYQQLSLSDLEDETLILLDDIRSVGRPFNNIKRQSRRGNRVLVGLFFQDMIRPAATLYVKR